ncbi:uncharacterized protein BJ212DRAFT_1487474 [Suillus subaureus]|uniref:Uncharacterized protein n=1 Tax=Suillus subaureus TaxID=48587 RepID=A0A9P7DSN8_9AGAM|nr:uncharacterized protein BJ212DRAFT_1487474 [Suillus subaureus]KAG1801993.1 hypothetical protein BJ212DRAFT_1487474 [Suillus subaureus]
MVEDGSEGVAVVVGDLEEVLDMCSLEPGMEAENATQHPGHILTRGDNCIKRRTKAQKATDDQCEEEEKEASQAAIQETHKCIAAFQKQLQTDQAAACADAPKPSRPRPHLVKKAAKAPETTDLTTAANKAVGAKGKGGRADKSAASANIEHPGSEEDEELEVQMPGGCTKKKGKRTVIPVKTPVRDAIDVAGALIASESTQAHDDDKLSDLDVSPLAPKKFGLAGHILNWMSSIPIGGSKPFSNLKHRSSGALSAISSTTPSSKLTRGSTMSSGGALLTPIHTPNVGPNDMSDLFTTLFADNELTDSAKCSQVLAHMSKLKAAQGVKISQKDSIPQMNLAHRNANPTPKQLNQIEPDITADDSAFNIVDDNLEMNVKTAPVVTSLVDYDSNNADLWPPHIAPSYSSHSTGVKRKLIDAEDALTEDDLIEDNLLEDNLFEDNLMIMDDFVIEDNLMLMDVIEDDDLMITDQQVEEDSPSSDIEFVGHVKCVVKPEPVVKTEYKPVSLRLTSTVTSISVKRNAPTAKRLKSSHSVSSIPSTIKLEAGPTNPLEVTVEILPCSLYRIKHLPGGPRAVARWSSVFIPTLISAIGDQDEVWGHIELEALFHATLQDTWDVVYEDTPHTITNDGPVMAIALQQLSEWCNGIGSTAVTVFTNFMLLQDDVKTNEDCKGFAESLLVNLVFLFLYSTHAPLGVLLTAITKECMRKALSVFVLQQHMECTIRLITSKTLVSELEVNSEGKAVKVPHSMNKFSGKISSS